MTTTGIETTVEHQVVGMCLRYPEVVSQAGALSGDDFADQHLGRLFEACRLIPDPPERPGPWPECDPSEWEITPLPEAWVQWVDHILEWRPRQASRLLMVNAAGAIALHDACGVLDAAPALIAELTKDAERRRYLLACRYAIGLIEERADPADIRAVFSDPDGVKDVLLGMV